MSSASPTPPRPAGSHPVGGPAKKRPWWLLLLLGLVVVAVLLLVLSRCGSDDSSTRTPTGASSSAATGTPSSTPSSSTPSAPASSPASSASGSTGSGGAAATPGTLTVGSVTLLPMSGAAPVGNLPELAGQPATAQGVQVLAVPADEGFWAGTSETDRVWVQLKGSGESPVQVAVGDLVDFTGKLVVHKAGFAAKAGVTEEEGAAQLTEQRAHLKVDRSTLMLSAPTS